MPLANAFYTEFDVATWPPRPTRGKGAEAGDVRTPFEVDRDRILFSYAFRRLQAKTQVFRSGEYDFYRTRLTHTIEVARLCRSLGKHLNATTPGFRDDFHLDVDLIEAVGLAHDLGHPPFGHIGERKLNELMATHGGFEGNAQTLRILTRLIWDRPEGPIGMDPTRALLDGVMKYKGLFSEQLGPDGAAPANHFLYDDQADVRGFVHGGNEPTSAAWPTPVECQLMDWADDTAYSLHDIIDGVKAGFLDPVAIETWAHGEHKTPLTDADHAHFDSLCASIRSHDLERAFARKIGQFLQATRLDETDPPRGGPDVPRYRYRLHIDPEIAAECRLYKRLAFETIFQSPPIQQIEFKSGRILERLFHAFMEHATKRGAGSARQLKILPDPVGRWVRDADESDRPRLLCDYLAGMTDAFAVRTYKRLFDPDFGSIVDLV